MSRETSCSVQRSPPCPSDLGSATRPSSESRVCRLGSNNQSSGAAFSACASRKSSIAATANIRYTRSWAPRRVRTRRAYENEEACLSASSEKTGGRPRGLLGAVSDDGAMGICFRRAIGTCFRKSDRNLLPKSDRNLLPKRSCEMERAATPERVSTLPRVGSHDAYGHPASSCLAPGRQPAISR